MKEGQGIQQDRCGAPEEALQLLLAVGAQHEPQL